MTDRLLLDTHIALWVDTDDRRLTVSSQRIIEDCWQGGGTVCLSAISVWEIAMLVNASRVDLDVPVDVWVARFLDRPGAEAVPLSTRAATRSYQFRELERRDPADRLLIATAIELGCSLVTYDAAIRRFSDAHGREYGFTAVA